MRRNSTYKNYINTSLFLCFLLFYNFLSSMYLFLPPLFGVLFLYFIRLFNDSRYYALFFFALVTFVYEIDKRFYPGILFIIYILVYILLFLKIVKIFGKFNIFEILYAPIIYISYFFINFFIMLLYNDNIDIWTPMIFLYILCEIILILVIRWIFGIK
ncbi:hypothetical protein CCY99_02600 [Helicobacter sp. 16-1353]|nr:hypothetical protein CCY99_02600 [Helicobacter sp. 16-1353]